LSEVIGTYLLILPVRSRVIIIPGSRLSRVFFIS